MGQNCFDCRTHTDQSDSITTRITIENQGLKPRRITSEYLDRSQIVTDLQQSDLNKTGQNNV